MTTRRRRRRQAARRRLLLLQLLACPPAAMRHGVQSVRAQMNLGSGAWARGLPEMPWKTTLPAAAMRRMRTAVGAAAACFGWPYTCLCQFVCVLAVAALEGTACNSICCPGFLLLCAGHAADLFAAFVGYVCVCRGRPRLRRR
jgi:hypothetical protein